MFIQEARKLKVHWCPFIDLVFQFEVQRGGVKVLLVSNPNKVSSVAMSTNKVITVGVLVGRGSCLKHPPTNLMVGVVLYFCCCGECHLDNPISEEEGLCLHS